MQAEATYDPGQVPAQPKIVVSRGYGKRRGMRAGGSRARGGVREINIRPQPRHSRGENSPHEAHPRHDELRREERHDRGDVVPQVRHPRHHMRLEAHVREERDRARRTRALHRADDHPREENRAVPDRARAAQPPHPILARRAEGGGGVKGVALAPDPSYSRIHQCHHYHSREHHERDVVSKEREGVSVPLPPGALQLIPERAQRHHVEPQVQRLEVCGGARHPPPPFVLDRDAIVTLADRRWIDAAIPVVEGQADVEEEQQRRAGFVEDEFEVLVLLGIPHLVTPAPDGWDGGRDRRRRGTGDAQERRRARRSSFGVGRFPYPAGWIPGRR